MAVMPLLLIFIITTTGFFVLQWYLSMQDNKYIGLILPSIYSLFALVIIVLFLMTPIKNTQKFYVLFIILPVVIHFVIYFICRKKVSKSIEEE